MYHIASTFIAPQTMMTSMQQAWAGSTFFFSAGPAVLGAVIHMMIGAMYGAVFGLLLAFVPLRGATLVLVGGLWGVVVFALSSWIAPPVAAAVFGSGDQITHVAQLVGYGTFLLEHVLFGLALGLVLVGLRAARD